ncbi:hypothetical protein NM688_g4202 [Phlebia brevispora]|uniref:Uncharacterized protein n=1 Tax=Phlebia brevispora TaxID=194682 RepID=A0ACC1T3B0_9APHY|nr:hypothetical protein NM688_g4202 [Phlebia brevispora]
MQNARPISTMTPRSTKHAGGLGQGRGSDARSMQRSGDRVCICLALQSLAPALSDAFVRGHQISGSSGLAQATRACVDPFGGLQYTFNLLSIGKCTGCTDIKAKHPHAVATNIGIRIEVMLLLRLGADSIGLCRCEAVDIRDAHLLRSPSSQPTRHTT